MFKRYAIYYTPSEGALAEFGAAWLGWDMAKGAVVAHPAIAGLPAPVHEITQAPRRYGFHGTIKPPFRLADGHDPDALAVALDALCRIYAPVTLAGLELSRLGGFLALVPRGDAAALGALAAQVVAALDAFRAPLLTAELDRRRQADLTQLQDAYLERWGYPYVMEAFRFHLTLTSRLEPDALAATEAALAPHLAPLLPAPFEIRDLTLVGEAGDGMFHTLHRFALSG
ncbi:MAG: DUF1045 domain-containing protein [Paracoccaceae bacterium]